MAGVLPFTACLSALAMALVPRCCVKKVLQIPLGTGGWGDFRMVFMEVDPPQSCGRCEIATRSRQRAVYSMERDCFSTGSIHVAVPPAAGIDVSQVQVTATVCLRDARPHRHGPR